ncbi:DUF4349 domain-containing protein [Flavobacterium sp. CYK-4]|uniref:DUF4349 domain-containing protein n=1 Tax=Flavobacterium lotistagni TaxID=2709660 RepID=UPI001409FC86|nr:DUF4349 domain-containing protein [Flavobacterium lotistagni]NHM07379.1 DUF4349 domain-containing protein [Flavobacterium lotistagni]
MKTKPRISLIVAGLLILAVACKQREAAAEEAAISNEKMGISADSTASPNANAIQMPERKFIRTAELKFKTKNVSQSTDAIEETVRIAGGFVQDSELESTINQQFSTKISQDSTLETTKYTVENNIVLRVPNRQFDFVLKSIAKEITFLDSRHLKADDVALQLLANEMASRRSNQHQKRLEKAIDTKGQKLNQITEAENAVNQTGTAQDEKKIENLALQDQVNFSTITLHLYQKETIKQEVVAREKDASDYQPQLGIQLVDALKSGWYVLESVFVFLVRIWSLILIVLVLFLAIRKYKK